MSGMHPDQSSPARTVLGNSEVATLLDTARRQSGAVVRISVPASRVLPLQHASVRPIGDNRVPTNGCQ